MSLLPKKIFAQGSFGLIKEKSDRLLDWQKGQGLPKQCPKDVVTLIRACTGAEAERLTLKTLAKSLDAFWQQAVSGVPEEIRETEHKSESTPVITEENKVYEMSGGLVSPTILDTEGAKTFHFTFPKDSPQQLQTIVSGPRLDLILSDDKTVPWLHCQDPRYQTHLKICALRDKLKTSPQTPSGCARIVQENISNHLLSTPIEVLFWIGAKDQPAPKIIHEIAQWLFLAPEWQSFRAGDPAPETKLPLPFHPSQNSFFKEAEWLELKKNFSLLWLVLTPDLVSGNMYDENKFYLSKGRHRLLLHCPSSLITKLEESTYCMPHDDQGNLLPGRYERLCTDSSFDLMAWEGSYLGAVGGQVVESSPSERPSPLNLKLNRQALIYDDQDSKNILGMGAFGKVLRGQYYDQSVAVKCFNQIHLTDLEKRNIENEAAVMSQLHSPFLVSLLGLGLDDPPVLIMELEQQSLYQLLKDISQDLPWLWRLRILRDIVLALVILHQHEVLHRDLKSLNILLDRDGRTKVGDFGFSTLKQVQDAKQFGTLLWTAPEVLEGKSASTATDMYSFGIICFEVVTRRLPYAGTLLSETLEKVKQGYRESIPTECPAALAKLIETCWAQDPQQRPSAVQAAALLEEMWQEAEKKEDKEIKTESKTVPHRPCCWQDTLSPSYTAALKLIQRRQQVLRQAATNLRGYVALDGQAQPGQTAEPLLPWIQQFLKDPPQALLLQGAAGAGKSTFLLYLEDCLWRDPAWQVFRIGDPWPRAPIPIGLPLGSTQVKARGIWKYLQIWGLTEAEIQWVQDHNQVVFLADGYDEIPQQETPNVFDANHLATWKNRVKLIMACRSQHVQSLSETACFVPHREDGMVDWNNYRSRYIAPFSAAQSKEYIAQFVAADPHRHPEWTEARYQEALQTLPASLIDTPFMLWMILSVLPNQPEVKTELDEKEEKEEKKEASSATTPVTRSRIYHWFLDTWFKRQAIKAWQARMYLQNPDQVLGKVLTQQLKVQAGNHGVEVQVEWLQQGYQLFCLILAQRLAELGQFQVSHDQISLETKGVWMKTLFGSSSDDYARLRQGCPVRRSNHAWSFIHASMLDYFISLSIAQGLLISLNEASPIQVELFARTHNQRSVLNQALALLMRGLLSAEQALFLADQVREQPVLEKALFQIVECTKTDKSLVTAAANAATVLNYSGASLTHLAWLGVDISGADLSNCILANGDFRGANFRKVRLMNSVLSGSDFRYACLEEVEWGELPRMELKHEVRALAHHPKEKWLAIGQEDRVEIRHRETAELVCAPFTGLTKIESVVFSPNAEFLGIIGKRKVDKYETDRINVWKIEGRQLFLDEGESVSNLVMVFSSDTKMLATYCGWGMGINATNISIWNLENKKDHS